MVCSRFMLVDATRGGGIAGLVSLRRVVPCLVLAVAVLQSCKASRDTSNASATTPVSASVALAALPPSAGKASSDEVRLARELDEKCPYRSASSGADSEIKEAMFEQSECYRRQMIGELDGVLLPMKRSEPERFKALMREQAKWNRFVALGCRGAEQRMWSDFETGAHTWGTMFGTYDLRCNIEAHKERILFARSWASRDPAVLQRRVTALRQPGIACQTSIQRAKQRAQHFVAHPPKDNDLPLGPADWKQILEDANTVETSAAELAGSTCAGWPEFQASLGGAPACQQQVQLYYLKQVQEGER